MRDKLRQLDETYLDLVIGILLCGVLSAILGMIITRGDLRYLIGAIVGTIFALVMITTMMVSIQKFYKNLSTSISRAEFYKNNVNHIFRVSNMEK